MEERLTAIQGGKHKTFRPVASVEEAIQRRVGPAALLSRFSADPDEARTSGQRIRTGIQSRLSAPLCDPVYRRTSARIPAQDSIPDLAHTGPFRMASRSAKDANSGEAIPNCKPGGRRKTCAPRRTFERRRGTRPSFYWLRGLSAESRISRNSGGGSRSHLLHDLRFDEIRAR